MSAKRYYVSDMSGSDPVLASLLSSLGETGTRFVQIGNNIQALCHVLATNHAALRADPRVLLLPDATLDTLWKQVGSATNRSAIETALQARGFSVSISGNTLFGEIIRALGQRFENSFSELNFSA